jgi:hypothetical protein
LSNETHEQDLRYAADADFFDDAVFVVVVVVDFVVCFAAAAAAMAATVVDAVDVDAELQTNYRQ